MRLTSVEGYRGQECNQFKEETGQILKSPNALATVKHSATKALIQPAAENQNTPAGRSCCNCQVSIHRHPCGKQVTELSANPLQQLI